jgi:hypothetical protein
VPKKNHSNPVERLATALEKKKEPPNPKGGNPPEAYRFRPGQSGNPSGVSRQRQRVAELIERMQNSSPPRQLCEELQIDPSVKWDEAILIVLGNAAMSGDVSAAREVLAALGISGTTARTNVLVNVEGEQGATFEFRRHAHGLSPEQLLEVWAFMDGLPRQKPVIDASYFPDDSYREQSTTLQLTEGTKEAE